MPWGSQRVRCRANRTHCGVVFVDLGASLSDPHEAVLRSLMIAGIGIALQDADLSVVVPERWSDLWCEDTIQGSPGGAFIQQISTDFFEEYQSGIILHHCDYLKDCPVIDTDSGPGGC